MAVSDSSNLGGRLFRGDDCGARDGEGGFGTDDSDLAIASGEETVPVTVSFRNISGTVPSQGSRTCLCRGYGIPCTRKAGLRCQLLLRQPGTRFPRPYNTWAKLVIPLKFILIFAKTYWSVPWKWQPVMDWKTGPVAVGVTAVAVTSCRATGTWIDADTMPTKRSAPTNIMSGFWQRSRDKSNFFQL